MFGSTSCLTPLLQAIERVKSAIRMSGPPARGVPPGTVTDRTVHLEAYREGHEGQAHKALGYDTSEAYIGAEFDMSARQSYRLLDQGQVIEVLEAASDQLVTPDVTEHQARRIKPHLEEIVEDIKQGTLPQEAIRKVLEDKPMDIPRGIGGLSRQKRALLDLKAGCVIILPHGSYACKSHQHCGLRGMVEDVRKTKDTKYITTHTDQGDLVVACFDPKNVEDLNY